MGGCDGEGSVSERGVARAARAVCATQPRTPTTNAGRRPCFSRELCTPGRKLHMVRVVGRALYALTLLISRYRGQRALAIQVKLWVKSVWDCVRSTR